MSKTYKTGWVKKAGEKIYAWSHAKRCVYDYDADTDTETTVADMIDNLNTAVNARVPYSVVTTSGTDLDDYTSTGIYYFSSSYTPTNIPAGVNGWLLVMRGNNSNTVKQMWWRHGTIGTNDYNTWIRTRLSSGWSDWYRLAVIDDSTTSTAKTYSSSQIASLLSSINSSLDTINSTLSNKITVKSIASLNCLELFADMPYIDFHFGSSSADYTSRIIEISSGTLNIPGNLSVDGTFTSGNIEPKSIYCGAVFTNEEKTATYSALEGKSYVDVYISCSTHSYARILRVYSGTYNGFVVYNSSQYNLRGYVYFDSSSGEVKFVIESYTGFTISNWILNTIYYAA